MSESRQPYAVNNAPGCDLPDDLKLALQLVKKNAASDEGKIALQCLASAAHPDYVCNLAMLASLPPAYREALRAFLNYCLSPGLSTAQQGAVLRIVEPLLAGAIGAPSFR